MVKKIFAGLKNETQILLFEEDSPQFNNIEAIFDFSLSDFTLLNFVENPNSHAKENEIYYISLSQEDEQSFFSKIKLNNDSIDYNLIQSGQYRQVDLIYLIDSENNHIYLQKISSIQHINARKVLWHDNGPKFETESDKIGLYNRVDVLYDISNKKIYFKNFNVLKSMFKEAIKFYKEATAEEVKGFLNEEKFDLNEEILDKVTDKFRRKVKCLKDKNINFSDQ